MLKIALFTTNENESILACLKRIDNNKKGFLIVVDNESHVLGTLTDGDIRRALIKGISIDESIINVYSKNCKSLKIDDLFGKMIDLFKNEAIKFLPIVDKDNTFVNLVTKEQMHALMLQDIHANLSFEFSSLDENIVDYEIFQRPWGFYKTTVMNEYFQSKIISVNPKSQLSLQSHDHREEHWIVAHGKGTVQLDNSIVDVRCGSSIYIPMGCKHRLTNTDETENLIITEIQIGDYFGEDDIHRYEDVYGRV